MVPTIIWKIQKNECLKAGVGRCI